MENTITLQDQRNMITNAIAQFKAEGKEIEQHNAECDLRTFDEAKPTGLKYKAFDGNVYETFSWHFTSPFTGGKKYQHGHMRQAKRYVMRDNVLKKDCFK